MIRWTTAVVLFVEAAGIALLVSSCTDDTPDPLHIDRDGAVHEIYLKDGTHCAVYAGAQTGSITCDWKN